MDTATWFEGAADWVGTGFNDVGGVTGHALVDAWRATSREADEFANAVEAAGIVVSDAFVEGVEASEAVLDRFAEVSEEWLLAAGRYVSEHACEIGLGSALSATFAALAADGEEEAATTSLAVTCVAEEFIDNLKLKTASLALAYVVVEPVYLIPGVKESLGHKDVAETAVAFAVFQACKEKRKLVVTTAGQYLVAVLIWVITQLVCRGGVLGLSTGWEGLQHEITS